MNRYYPHTIIAQEGWSFIIGGLVASVFVSFLGGWWSLPFWIFTLFCVNFFRDPARNIPEAPDAIISPADGRVVVVERTIDPYRNTEALKISVFMNVFNVHSQRSPVSGKVSEIKYNAGKFLNASLDKSSTENERNAVLMTTHTGREITFVQVAGLVARRILCYVNKGDSMVRGERYGFIRFGSRVDVYLPLDATANVAIGDKVRASETILAYLPLEPSEVLGDLLSPSSKAMAETRLKSDVKVATASVAHSAEQSGNTQPAPLTLDEARLAAETAHLKAEAQAAKQAAEQAKIEAQAEIARLKAEAEQARAEIEQTKAQAQAEVARFKAEQEAKLKAQEQTAQLVQEQAEQVAQAKAEAQAARAQAQQEAQARVQAEAQAKAQAEQAAQAQAEIARVKAEQEAQAKVQAEKAQQEAKLKAEQEAQAAKARAHAEEVAKAQAAAKAKEEALAKAKAETEAKQKAEQEAKQKAAQEAKVRIQAEQQAKAKAEAEALAEIAARKPIVRREVFAAVPEPWQTIEPREVIIRTEVVDSEKN